ncbi:MAG: BT_3928 family protein [Bacteroidales bacterium]
MDRFLIWLSRYLLGVTFIFSGFVKGIDPLGSAYKFGDYFLAFGLDFLMPYTLALSFILCAAELFVGLLLILNVRQLVGVWGALLFMGVFTPLTLVIAILDPVSDCGCFGDAIIMSNWETFFKNIPLLAASILLFYKRRKISSAFPLIPDFILAAILLFISFSPSIYGYRNLPMLDFRPYSIGTNIAQAMEVPPDAPMDEYETILYYEKDGEVKEFTEDNFPWQDTTWTFVDSESVLVKEGYKPPIDDFVLTDLDGADQTDNVLYYPGHYILAVSPRLNKTNVETFEKLNEIYFKAQDQGIGFACVTASSSEDINSFVGSTGVAFPFLMADEIMLKTTVRANPGIILLNEGTIIGKWHYRNIPEASFFEGNLTAKSLELIHDKNQRLWTYLLVVMLVLVKFALILLNFRMSWFKYK